VEVCAQAGGWIRASLTARKNGPVIVHPETPTDYEETRALVTVTMRPVEP
jgi:hypothetical protein